MDKKLILAVAGSGKTSTLLKIAGTNQRSLIVTYTNSNHNHIINKILEKNNNKIPENITVLTYVKFLYNFCYKPFLSDKIGQKSLTFNKPPCGFMKDTMKSYYMNKNRQLYSNRIAKLILKYKIEGKICDRISEHYDNFMIDEIQDIAGNDFNLILKLINTKCNVYYVGDYHQHTYDTSRDNNVNKNLYNNFEKYITLFKKHKIEIDTKSLDKSYRCGSQISKFVTENLGIEMHSHSQCNKKSAIIRITDKTKIKEIIDNDKIIKLLYRNARLYPGYATTWGKSKGLEFEEDVCVVLNKTTYSSYKKNKLIDLQPSTKNKLYVALTRTTKNVLLITQEDYEQHL